MPSRSTRIMPTRREYVMDRAARVRAWLEQRADEMAALLEELVAVDTANPPGRGLGRSGPRAVPSATAGGEDHRTRGRGHEGRTREHALRRRGGAAARTPRPRA